MKKLHSNLLALGAVVAGCALLAFSLCDVSAPAEAGAQEPEPAAPKAAPLALEVGQCCTVMLESNAGTGYAWQLAEPSAGTGLLRVELFGTQPCESGCCGFPVPVTCNITALKPGRELVRLVYVRPWEKDKTPADEKCFLVTVTEKGK